MGDEPREHVGHEGMVVERDGARIGVFHSTREADRESFASGSGVTKFGVIVSGDADEDDATAAASGVETKVDGQRPLHLLARRRRRWRRVRGL